MLRCPSRFTLFPYTTLFRSHGAVVVLVETTMVMVVWEAVRQMSCNCVGSGMRVGDMEGFLGSHVTVSVGTLTLVYQGIAHLRSEEHTSELQSPDHLVCRLLL